MKKHGHYCKVCGEYKAILNPYGMGIEAAAYATIFSQFVQAAITLW